MKDMETQFRDTARQIRISPHPRTWDRIEGRVRAHRGERKLINTRLFAFAAAILCLIAISAGTLFYAKWQHAQSMVQYSQSMEELNITNTTDAGIYRVDRIKAFYAEYARQ